MPFEKYIDVGFMMSQASFSSTQPDESAVEIPLRILEMAIENDSVSEFSRSQTPHKHCSLIRPIPLGLNIYGERGALSIGLAELKFASISIYGEDIGDKLLLIPLIGGEGVLCVIRHQL